MPKTPQHSSPLHRAGSKSPAASEFYTIVFEQSPVPMWVVDAITLRFIAVNDAAVRDTGYSRSELLELAVPALCPSADLVAILSAPLEPNGQPRACLGRLLRNGRAVRQVHMTWTPLAVEDKPAWLVLLMPFTDHEPRAVARPLPELVADLVEANRALQAAVEESRVSEARNRRLLKATLETSRATELLNRATLHARDIHLYTMQHRVKTSLQLAASLFNLQRAQHQDPRVAAPFASAAQRLQVLALLHETLDHAGPAHGLNGAAYLQAVRAAVIRSARVDTNRISFAMHLESVILPIAQAMPCGLILNELLTNAVTHAFPEGRSGKVTIEFRSAPDGLVMLRVTDSGIGVPAGLDIHQPTSLGWQLLTLLTQQLHGAVELERGHGTRITVQWPHWRGTDAHRRG
jgi:two-component sensor histidine kinase